LPHCELKYTGLSEHQFYTRFSETLAAASYCHDTYWTVDMPQAHCTTLHKPDTYLIKEAT